MPRSQIKTVWRPIGICLRRTKKPIRLISAESHIEMRPFGFTGLVYQIPAFGNSFEESELMLQLLSLLQRYANLLSETTLFLGKDNYRMNLQYQIEMHMLQISHNNSENVLIHSLYDHLVHGSLKPDAQVHRQIKQLIQKYSMPKKKLVLQTNEHWLQKASSRILSSTLWHMLSQNELIEEGTVLSFLREYREREILRQTENVRYRLMQWCSITTEENCKRLWNSLEATVRNSSDFYNSTISSSVKLHNLIYNSDGSVLTLLLHKAYQIQHEELMKIRDLKTHLSEQLISRLQSSEIVHKMQERRNITEMFQSLTETETEYLHEFIDKYIHEDAVLQRLNEHLISKNELTNYLETLSESESEQLLSHLQEANIVHKMQERRNITEMLQSLTETETNYLHEFIGEYVHEDAVLHRLNEHLISKDKLSNYLNTLTESESEQLISRFQETNIVHKVQERRNITEMLQSLTEAETNYLHEFIGEYVHEDAVLQHLNEHLISKDKLSNYLNTLTKSESEQLLSHLQDSKIVHKVQERRNITEMLQSLTETETEYLHEFIGEYVHEDSILQCLNEHLISKDKLSNYLNTLTESESEQLLSCLQESSIVHKMQERRNIAEMLQSLTETETNYLHEFIGEYVHEDAVLQRLSEHLISKDELSNYLETLSESESEQLLSRLQESNIIHKMQERRNITEMLQSLTETETNYLHEFIGEYVHEDAVLQRLNEHLISKDELTNYLETLTTEEGKKLINRKHDSKFIHMIRHETIQDERTCETLYRLLEKTVHTVAAFTPHSYKTSVIKYAEDLNLIMNHPSAVDESQQIRIQNIHADNTFKQDIPSLMHKSLYADKESYEELEDTVQQITEQLNGHEQSIQEISKHFSQEQISSMAYSQLEEIAENVVRRVRREVVDSQRRNGIYE